MLRSADHRLVLRICCSKAVARCCSWSRGFETSQLTETKITTCRIWILPLLPLLQLRVPCNWNNGGAMQVAFSHDTRSLRLAFHLLPKVTTPPDLLSEATLLESARFASQKYQNMILQDTATYETFHADILRDDRLAEHWREEHCGASRSSLGNKLLGSTRVSF